MPTPTEWLDDEYRTRLAEAAEPACTHEITEQVFCEEDCCGASLLWEECRCHKWVRTIDGKRMTFNAMCGLPDDV